ncbi:MAG: class I SAM-dependent methyltransferase [Promethearchaeota archaeon]|jgi:SAM-dependent methyltransferase
MYEEIIKLLKCPKCDESLCLIDSVLKNGEIIEGTLKCSCDELWEISDGILNFRVEEQESVNRWSDLTKDMSFEELDEMILSKTPQNQKELILKTIQDIIDYLNLTKPAVVIDIATGRGMLLNEIAKQLKNEFQLVCIDLSYVVLKADRKKIQKHNPKIKVSFVSCDATNLPFFDNSYDLALSLLGISNMGELIPKALKETRRVLKNDHKFINSTIIIEENSEGYKQLKEFFDGQDSEGFEKFMLEDEFEKFHKDAGFKEAAFKLIDESIGQKNELDLLPYEGEWFGIGNIYAKK